MIVMLKMIVQIMSCDKCVSHMSLATDCVRCKNSTNYTYCTNCTDEVARSTSVIFVNHTIMQRDLHERHEFFRRLASRVLKSNTNGGRNLTEMC